MANKSYSLAHTKWMCKYHIVFTPKYRRKEIYNQVRKDLIEIFKRLCKYKGVEIIEGHMMPDHVHMLVAIPPKMASRSPSLISKFNPVNNSIPFHSFDTSCKRTNVIMRPHPSCILFAEQKKPLASAGGLAIQGWIKHSKTDLR